VPLLDTRVAICLKGFSEQKVSCFKQKVPLSGGLLSVATKTLKGKRSRFQKFEKSVLVLD
jgi:hypothetical protein